MFIIPKNIRDDLSSAFRNSDHGPLERMHREQEPLAWLGAGLCLLCAAAMLVTFVAWVMS